MTTLKEALLKAILEDEKQYCFDKSYTSDETWEIENDGVTRQEAYDEAVEYYTNASVDDILKEFGDKYDDIVDKYSRI